MNVFPKEKQTQIINALVEGNSIRATARMIGIEHKTVMRVLLRVGKNCEKIMNERMRKLPCKAVQVDEILTYVGKHERFVRPSENSLEVGDQYVFVAIDSETKLVPSFKIGKRDAFTNVAFYAGFERTPHATHSTHVGRFQALR